MATLSNIMQVICNWLETEIAPEVSLKRKKNGARDNDYVWTHPIVLPFSSMPVNLMPDNQIAPSVTVRLGSGSVMNGEGRQTVRLELAVFNAGTTERDYINVSGGQTHGVDQDAAASVDSETGTVKKHFEQNNDGCFDLLRFAQKITDNLEAKDAACGFRKDGEIKYGFPLDKESFTGTYPYFYMTIEFDIVYGAIKNRKEIEDMLI